MGSEQRNTPAVTRGVPTFTWRFLSPMDPGVGAVITHTPSEFTIGIQFFDREVLLPLTQARWIANVLMEITEGYEDAFNEAYPGMLPDEGDSVGEGAAESGGDAAD